MVIAAGGVVMALLAHADIHETADGMPILNGITNLVKLGEMAVKMNRLMGGRFTSKRCTYAPPPPDQIAEFRRHYGADIYPTVKEKLSLRATIKEVNDDRCVFGVSSDARARPRPDTWPPASAAFGLDLAGASRRWPRSQQRRAVRVALTGLRGAPCCVVQHDGVEDDRAACAWWQRWRPWRVSQRAAPAWVGGCHGRLQRIRASTTVWSAGRRTPGRPPAIALLPRRSPLSSLDERRRRGADVERLGVPSWASRRSECGAIFRAIAGALVSR